MALETGTFVDDLVSSNPVGASDPKSQGDDHIRLVKSVLQATFPVAGRAVYFESAAAAKTGNYTVLITDEGALIRMDATAAARTATLILGSSAFAGFKVTIMKSDTSVNIVTVDGNGAETINGDLTKILRRPYETITVMWEGTEWKIVDRGFDETEMIEGAAVASVASPNIWEGDGNTHHITGTTTITGFAAAPQAGARRYLIFDAAVLLTDSATLNIQGDTNYTTALDDIVEVYAETTTVFKLVIHPKSGLSVVGGTPLTQGKHTIWVPAAAMRQRVANGCAFITSVQTTANRPDYHSLDFSTSAEEHAQFSITMPKSWDEGNITFRTHHTHAGGQTAGLDGVTWGLKAVAVSSDDTIDVAFPAAENITVDMPTAEDEMVSAESAAFAVGGSPVDLDRVNFDIGRIVADGGDDLNIDARLLGVEILYTINAGNDA